VNEAGSLTSTTATSVARAHRGKEVGAVVDRRGDLEPVRVEQPDQAIAEQEQVSAMTTRKQVRW